MMTWNDISPRLKWTVLLGIIMVKLALFAYFTMEFNHFWKPNRIINGFVIIGGDSYTYYIPAEDLANGLGYTSLCRMPGIVPVYNTFRLFFSMEVSKGLVVLSQLIFGIAAVWYFSRLIFELLKSEFALVLGAILLSLSSFMSIWDHFLMSDSFANSAVMISAFLLWKFIDSKELRYLLVAATLLSWSVFLRQINIVVFPMFGLVILNHFKFSRMLMKSALVMAFPLFFSIGTWTAYNYVRADRFVPLVIPFTECFQVTNESAMSFVNLAIAWGYDSQPWIEGTPSNWFFQDKTDALPPLTADKYTSEYNADSLMLIKQHYLAFAASKDSAFKAQEKRFIVSRANRYFESYKANYAFDYWVKNRLGLLVQFVFPSRINNFPYPQSEQFNTMQSLVSGLNYLLIIFASFSSIAALFICVIKKRWELFFWFLIPWSIVITLSCVLGFIEQRYLVPTFPFFILTLVYVVVLIQKTNLHNLFSKK